MCNMATRIRSFTLEGSYLGRMYLRMARSLDGGRSFEAPVQIGGEAVEGAVASLGMTNLFGAPDGALYASWLDSRESIAYVQANKKHPPKNVYSSQLRVARSDDRGLTFQKSTLVTEPVCVCCGTKVAQGKDGPVYAGTRGLAWGAVKGSADPVRDIVVAASQDRGATWDGAVKLHDDGFKVSACPDVTAGLAVDSKGRLHAAWYTGSDKRPGVFYAVSSDHGKSFSEPVALLTDDWLPYGDVKLALDAKDNAFVAFEDRRGDEDLIRVARIGADGAITHAAALARNRPRPRRHRRFGLDRLGRPRSARARRRAAASSSPPFVWSRARESGAPRACFVRNNPGRRARRLLLCAGARGGCAPRVGLFRAPARTRGRCVPREARGKSRPPQQLGHMVRALPHRAARLRDALSALPR